MTPVRIAAFSLGVAGLVGVGLVVGDLLADDPDAGAAPSRAEIEVANDEGLAATRPSLSVVSIGGAADGGDAAVDGDGPGDDTAEGGADAAGGDRPVAGADLGSSSIDVDALAVFDSAVDAGSGDVVPDVPGGVTVDEPEEAAYGPLPGDEGTVDDLDDLDALEDLDVDGAGEGAVDAGDDPVERPEGVPPLDPDVYELDVELPPVVGFDDPCAVGSAPGCPSGIPAVVLGDDPTVPLRLGSVGLYGTETFHRTACRGLRTSDTGGTRDDVLLVLTTNQDAELEVAADGGNRPVVVARPEEPDLALAQLVGELRADGRTPSEGPGSVITCVSVPTSAIEDGLLRGKALATAGDQRDTLPFELRLGASERSAPIRIGATRGPAPAGSTPFALTVPQADPSSELVAVGFVPLDDRDIGPTACDRFGPELDELRATTLGGRDRADGRPAPPWVFDVPPDPATHVAPYGTLPVLADVADGYDATVRGYLPQRSRFRLCVWWFDLEPDGDAHRISSGAPSDTASLDVRTPTDIRAGVYVTAITLPEARPAGHYNLYLVKPGLAAICRPAKRPAPFPVGPTGDEAATPFPSTRVAESDPGLNQKAADDGAPPPGDNVAVDRIPAGRYEFGPRQAQQVVPICVPRALAPLAVPMVKAGDRAYLPGSAPIPVGADIPLVPDGLEPPPIGKTFPVVARDGAVLELTVVNAVTARQAGNWFVGRETTLPPATVRSTVDLVANPVVTPGEERGTVLLGVRFNENVAVRVRPTTAIGEDPFDVCTTAGASTEASSPAGPAHDLTITGLCAGVTYGFSIDATDADGSTTTFEGGAYRVPPNAGFFDVAVEVTSAPDDGAELSVADVQFLRQPGVVSLSARVRGDDLLGTCLSGGEVDDDETVLTSFGERATVRVRLEGAAACDGGPALRVDSTLELAAADLVAGPLVFDVSHPSGLVLQVTITPRDVTG